MRKSWLGDCIPASRCFMSVAILPDRAGKLGDTMATDLSRVGTSARALFGMSSEELRAVVEGLGLPKYRAVQLGDALYKQRVGTLEEITTLPLEVRERLAAGGDGVGPAEVVQGE